MPGRRLSVGSLIVALAFTASCASSPRSARPLAPAASNGVVSSALAIDSSNPPNRSDTRPPVSPAYRVLALAAAHREADQLAVGRSSQKTPDWPSGVSEVLAVVQVGTETDSNTGYTCDSGRVLAVRLVGAFDTVIAGTPTSDGTSAPDTTVREVDLTVDATTGLTCWIAVRTEPDPQGGDVLYRR